MMKLKKNSIFRRLYFYGLLLLGNAWYNTSLFAQSGSGSRGSRAISEATNELKSYFEPAVTLIYVIGALVGLIGAIRVYNKFSSGDQDTGKVAASWFGACVFLIVAASALKLFFLN